jgi:murein DD-endopeptidase MepM/ murein hydrolase activator NlpD
MQKLQILILGILTIPILSFNLFQGGVKTISLNKASLERNGTYKTKFGDLPFNTVLVSNQVKSNDYLSTIFLKHRLSVITSAEISKLSNDDFDTKKIRSGNNYAFVMEFVDGKFEPNTFIYEKNKIEYVKVALKDEISISKYKRPIHYVERNAEGLITSSLYETLISDGANPLLAINLSEIYAWTIDFYRIQKNDYFNVIYLEAFVEDEPIGEFKILASNFNHFGKDKFAYYFEEECKPSTGNYYDSEGNSLKRAFLKAPVKYSRISSKYSNARLHPVTKVMKAHLGTDYAAPEGTPIYATANGTIEAATYNKGNGNYVKIKHNKVYSTQYLHMSKIAQGIKPGVYVQQGQVIGYVGSTGLATGPHVCYRFWKNGQQVDPYKEDMPEYESLEGAKLEEFLKNIEPYKTNLSKQINIES